MSPPPARSSLTFALSIALGGVAGAVATTVLGAWHKDAPRVGVDVSAAEVPPPAGPVDNAERARVRLLEQRVAELENEKQRAPGPAAQPAAPLAAMPPPTEADRASAAQHVAAVSSFRTDPRDPKWAPARERVLGDGLRRTNAPAPFEVTAVECKTTWCRAEVSFGSYDAARTDLRALLAGDYRGACAVSIDLPTPPDPAARYAATAVYDCQAARTE